MENDPVDWQSIEDRVKDLRSLNDSMANKTELDRRLLQHLLYMNLDIQKLQSERRKSGLIGDLRL